MVTVLTSASIAAGTTTVSRPTPKANAKSVNMSERSSRSSAESRCQGGVRQYCIWPVVDAVSEHSIGTLMWVVVGVADTLPKILVHRLLAPEPAQALSPD